MMVIFETGTELMAMKKNLSFKMKKCVRFEISSQICTQGAEKDLSEIFSILFFG
jgi:hypothetical protein